MADTDHAWSPGLTSEIPSRLLPLVTLFRPENASVSYAEAKADAAYCGLKPAEMAAPTVERLIVHEVLIRVTADLSVPDGPKYAELGINLRHMTQVICNHVFLTLPQMQTHFDGLQTEVEAIIGGMLTNDLRQPVPKQKPKGMLTRLFGRHEPDQVAETAELTALAHWKTIKEPLVDAACAAALVRIVGGMVGQHGRLLADDALITRFAKRLVMNTHGAQQLGTWIAPLFKEAAKAADYHFLPAQEKPCFLNVKGASASGKSTIRPLQRQLATKLGIPWEDFALISPDYWRKFLLDYDSMDADYKYAAMLTGQELEIIDKKLDLYIAEKAKKKAIPHMLIDRFRFDSFVAEKDSEKGSNLLTRFGDTVYMFFIITPPAATVERAWKRGLTTGRYKAVDDLLYHNIEAYRGIPKLFFKWVQAQEMTVHFEFLDNSVKLGETPRTIAFGWNDTLTILDAEKMADIDRFAEVDLTATRPEDALFLDRANPFQFIHDCANRLPLIRLADFTNGKILAEARDGNWHITTTKRTSSDFIKSLKTSQIESGVEANFEPIDIDKERRFTLGAWGSKPAG